MSSRGRNYLIAVGVALVLFFAARSCMGPSPRDFTSTDSTGHMACQAFADAQGAGGSVYRDHIRQVGGLAHRSETGSLANLALPNFGGKPVIGDFRDVCEDHGFDF